MTAIELKENSKVVWKCVALDEEWIGTGVSFELIEKDNSTTVILNTLIGKSEQTFIDGVVITGQCFFIV
ncbi:hypothetical protein SYJ56_22185 [Algoriphagus sp. D3-2-R+10]|uniref:hypothetical protein n=1 Tax=Algoriphagus aurantiacus TaxID=3103948 RepID=UPI002B3EC21A|nr:hypothetical protein [Algoriphagus sp. D3-2-R+10]MEB2778038.1 hypothetical protein [Algoriphagus sp. D3-2-R+10]